MLLFALSERPWGFEYWVCYILRPLAIWFIFFTNFFSKILLSWELNGSISHICFMLWWFVLNFSRRKYLPKCSANTMEASLPLGSITPCSRSYTLRRYPSLRLAEVPPIVAALFETLQYRVLGSNFQSLITVQTKCAVIILVREAISHWISGDLEKSGTPLFPSNIDHDLAVTWGRTSGFLT